MALIYKIEFPENPFTNIEGEISSTGGNDTLIYDNIGFRPFYPPVGIITVPNIDVSSKDFKVKSKTNEINSKITYDIAFVGETAKQIIQYIKFVRLPNIQGGVLRPAAGLEYQFNLDKQIGITIEDTCCAGVDGRKLKLILNGMIPLNTIRYCEKACTVNGTIYEDSNRTQALKCFESTVLGLRSNIPILRTAEYYTDVNYFNQTNTKTETRFANVSAKWFDVCVEPQSTGIPLILTNFIGIFKLMLTGLLFPLFSTISIIISAINLIPGVNVSNPITTFASNLIDDALGLERVVEGLFGCKYVRGGYRVASIITAACSICGLSKEELSLYDFIKDNDTQASINMLDVKVPITANPFVLNGNMSGILGKKKDTYNTAYMPADEAYKRKKEENLNSSVSDIAIRAASIETTDKIFERLSSLWGTSWNVVNTPKSGTTSKELQLQLGPIDSRYSFSKADFVNIPEMKVCYKVSDGSPIGYSTTWQQDSSDIPSNKQTKNFNGYVTYYFSNLKGRKGKDIRDYSVQFAPAHYIGSLKDDSVYDDLAADRSPVVGFTQLNEFFEDGTLIQGSEFTTAPKLIRFNVKNTNVLNFHKTCRVDKHNDIFSASYRMSTDIYTEVAFVTTSQAILTPVQPVTARPVTGIQSFIPHYTIGYFGETNQISLSYSDGDINSLTLDYLNKYGSDEVSYSDALPKVRGKFPSYLGPFNNLRDYSTLVVDNKGYKFAPLMEFDVTVDDYECGNDDLFNECVNTATRLTPTVGVDDLTINYKLRLVKLSLGLGVITELEIDYENRKIEASGYVIPFVQDGIDYSV